MAHPVELTVPSTITARALTASQAGIWMLERVGGPSSSLVLNRCWELAGRLDEAVLRQAVRALLARHEALRSFVVETASGPVQRIADAAPAPLEVCESPGADLDAFFSDKFDLTAPGCLRVLLAPTAQGGQVLGLRTHHLFVDGFGLRILVGDLAALYTELAAGRPVAATRPPQFDAFLAALDDRLASPAAEAAMRFWLRRLSGLPAPVTLPPDAARSQEWNSAGGTKSFHLPEELVRRLERLARERRTTLFPVLHAAFAVLLVRSAGAGQVTVGVPMSARHLVPDSGFVGMAVNVVPLRADLTTLRTFGDVVSACRATMMESLEHAWLPLELVVDRLGLPRAPGSHPLHHAILSYHDIREDQPLLFAGVPARTHPDSDRWSVSSRTDLTLQLTREASGMSGRLEFNSLRYEPQTIARAVERLAALLDNAARAPDTPWQRLDLLPAAERRTVLRTWNQTHDPRPYRSVLSMIEEQAAEDRSRLAVVGGGGRLTYGQLVRRVDRLAVAIARRAAGPGSRVGVLLDRTPSLIVALLAIWKAGAAYVPLDPAYPRERLAYLVADSGTKLVVTQQNHRHAVPAELARLCLDADAEEIAKAGSASASVEAEADPAGVSHVIYTSGSTGQPKGAVIERRSVANLIGWACRELMPDQDEFLLASTSVCFDISVIEVFLPLATGNTVVLVDNILNLWDAPPSAPVTVVNTVPSALTALLRAGHLPPSCRRVWLAGEPLSRSLADRLYDSGVSEVRNLFGPSETTTYSTQSVVSRDPSRPVTIGRPIDNTRAYVLDEWLDPVPIGAPGELFLGGAGVAREYTGRPELTAERFVADPFVPGERVYRTGDIVRWRGDGELLFLGRRDHQVKVRGFRIELGEVESVVGQLPGVEQVCCVVRGEGPQAHLVCYASGAGLTVDAIHTHATRLLPAAMVPGRVVLLDELPQNRNGKVDRGALPDPQPEAAGIDVATTASGDGMLALVATQWCRALGVGSVDMERNVFELGGTSLLLTQVHAALCRELGSELPLTAMFRYPTVRALATYLSGQG